MYWKRAVYFSLVDHLVLELNDRFLSQEDSFLGQYLQSWTKLLGKILA